MDLLTVKHNAEVLIGDYQFASSLNDEVQSLLGNGVENIGHSNVKAIHTVWNWEPKNIIFNKFKSYLINEVEKRCKPGSMVLGDGFPLKMFNFWANIYSKGDYALPHKHLPYTYSFVYFVKTKWYDSPLVFSNSGKRIRPKVGRYIVFPSFLEHHVPKHRYKDYRITLSGNMKVEFPK